MSSISSVSPLSVFVYCSIDTQLHDIQPTWASWTCELDANVYFDSMRYAGPGHYIMPDMLEVGNGMTTTEDRSHFSMWAMIAAPLVRLCSNKSKIKSICI